MRYLISIIILLLITGCAGQPIKMELAPQVVEQMNAIYNPVLEKGFCVSDRVYNVLPGTPISCMMPLCEKDSIVFHTHPCFDISCANFVDVESWKQYKERYGNNLFGVMCGKGRYKIYNLNQ